MAVFFCFFTSLFLFLFGDDGLGVMIDDQIGCCIPRLRLALGTDFDTVEFAFGIGDVEFFSQGEAAFPEPDPR